MSFGGAEEPSGAGVSPLAVFAIPTARPANAASFFRNLRRPESFGCMRFSYGKLSPRLNKGGAHCQRNGAGTLSQGINQILKNETGRPSTRAAQLLRWF